jgi:tRNA threonylcarbamoyladenosine biosynthesis protein TsaB
VLLAIDTATRSLGIALHSGSEVLTECVWATEARHTVELAPEVAIAVRRTGAEFRQLTAVAVALGPGSYTGLRIGLALAKGLALAHKLTLIGVPTLDILAHSQPAREEPMVCVLQAGRGRVAALWYKWGRRSWKASGAPKAMSWEQLGESLKKPSYICGELGKEGREVLRGSPFAQLAPPSLCIRRPSALAELAWSQIRTGKLMDAAAVVPQYLATSAAETA